MGYRWGGPCFGWTETYRRAKMNACEIDYRLSVLCMCRRNDPTVATDSLAEICAAVSKPLAAVEAQLRRHTRLEHPDLTELSSHVDRYHGKMLRPMLLLLAGDAVGTLGARHINLATVVELVHLATLVHDDVLDNGEVRRNMPTVRRLWGNEASVLLGDHLLAEAFDLCNRTGDLEASCAISQVAKEVCQGELVQCLRRGDWTMQQQDYMEIIELKTAKLYHLCCYLGGHLSGGSEDETEALSQYGRLLGCAFQITDDLLDILGHENLTGKTLGSDLSQAKATLPVIHCLQNGDADTKERLSRLLVRRDESAARPVDVHVDEVCSVLDHSGSLEYARNEARSFADRAKRCLEILPACAARDAMALLADFVVDRSC